MRHQKPLPHGTVNGYIGWGCRCEECQQARRDYYGHKSRADYDAERAAQHGTESKYTRGCRCEDCREAANAERRRRRRTPNVRKHGTAAGYSNGCRCEDCRRANTLKRREWRGKVTA